MIKNKAKPLSFLVKKSDTAEPNTPQEESHWVKLVVEAVEEPLGELKEARPSWYSIDYYFRDDVICDNIWKEVKVKLNIKNNKKKSII